MKKKLFIVVSVLIVAFLGFAVAAFAQEASVFGDNVLIRAYLECASGCGAGQTPLYSAYLEVRDDQGVVLSSGDFYVKNVGNTDPPLSDNKTNPVQIHDGDLTSPDLSMSYDDATKTVYVFCISDAEGLHVMTYDIGLSAPPPVDGVCGSASGVPSYSKPTDNLCGDGASPTVTGTGPWYWTCPGTNGGNPSPQCSAQRKADGVCGSANGQPFPSKPTDNLCGDGASPTVTGTGPWYWTCPGTNGGNPSPQCSAQLQQGSPDLTVSASGFPSAYNVGMPFTLSVTVRNQGDAAAGPSTLRAYEAGRAAGGVWSVPGLSPGESASSRVTVVPVGACSIHSWCTFSVKADADNQVSESNESNNTASKSAYRGR
jgi:hypothetical protein